MRFLWWFAVPGWPLLVGAVGVFTLVGALAHRAGHPERVPWCFLAVWSCAAVTAYLMVGTHRYFPGYLTVWAAQVATIAIILSLPLGLSAVGLSLGARVTRHARAQLGLAIAMGVLGLPLAGLTGQGLGDLFRRWLTP